MPKNLVDIPIVKPFTTPGSFGKYFWLSPVPRTVVIPSAGNTRVNVGIFTKAILAQPEKTQGKCVACVADALTQDQFLQYWSAATGKPAAFMQAEAGDWIKAYGSPGEEAYLNMKAFEENPEWYLDNSPLLAKDLGIDQDIVNTEAAFKSFGEKLL